MLKLHKIRFYIIIFASLLILEGSTFCAVPEKISTAFQSGNCSSLNNYIKGTVKLVIKNEAKTCSGDEAIKKLNKFFSINNPINFKIKHTGGKPQLKYAIGDLATTKGNYRVHLLMKDSNSHTYINELRITSKNE
jgi:hypothetical protein